MRTTNPYKRGWTRAFRKGNIFCSTTDTRRVKLVNTQWNVVKEEKEGNCDYDKRSISVVICDTEIRHNDDNSSFEVPTSNFYLTTSNPWLTVILYQGNADRNHKLWNYMLIQIHVYKTIIIHKPTREKAVLKWSDICQVIFPKVRWYTASGCARHHQPPISGWRKGSFTHWKYVTFPRMLCNYIYLRAVMDLVMDLFTSYTVGEHPL